jgi:hypothetical protein
MAYFDLNGEEVWKPLLLRMANVMANTASKGGNKF